MEKLLEGPVKVKIIFTRSRGVYSTRYQGKGRHPAL